VTHGEKSEKSEATWRSKAVVASDGLGNGCVIWYVGGALESEIEEAGLTDLSDLGLNDAPQGISVWEGVYIWLPGGHECPDDGTTDPSGAFRPPTAEEWTLIQSGKNPWADSKAIDAPADTGDGR
jgi:hypothetical protein